MFWEIVGLFWGGVFVLVVFKWVWFDLGGGSGRGLGV